MTVRVDAAPSVLSWALDVSGAPADALRSRFQVDRWIARDARPTLKQLEGFATASGVPFGYLLLDEPPEWRLPIPDFREGFASPPRPSTDLIAVVNLAQRRQDWYRDYTLAQGAEPLAFVGSAVDATPGDTAADIRRTLNIEVDQRTGTWDDTRKLLLRAFETAGGLTIATSMVANNTHRLLDPDEFRGFTLVDDVAPLVFVNTHQSINGQIFTLAHEFAHVWRGTSGVGNEDLRSEARSGLERWCNAVASETLVPAAELRDRYGPIADGDTAEVIQRLARQFHCGTLVVLQALHRKGLRAFPDFRSVYDAEVQRLARLQEDQPAKSGGDHYNNQPFRIGERLSRALIADTLEGRTGISEAMSLMSMKSLSTFNEYAQRLEGP